MQAMPEDIEEFFILLLIQEEKDQLEKARIFLAVSINHKCLKTLFRFEIYFYQILSLPVESADRGVKNELRQRRPDTHPQTHRVMFEVDSLI